MEQARTEAPTPRRLARARERGEVSSSPDLTASAALFGLLLALSWTAGELLTGARVVLDAALRSPADIAHATPELARALRALVWPVLALLLIPVACAALAGFLQVGPLFASARIGADLGRLDPVATLRAMFSGERLLQLAWTLLKLAALLTVAAYTGARLARALLAAPAAGVVTALDTTGAAALQLLLRLGIAGALLGAIDLVYRRAVLLRALRMTRHELAEEHKQTHGAPEARAERRRLQRLAAAAAELAAVEQAQVLLLDARGRSVALAFDASDPRQYAPRVVAKAPPELSSRMQLAAERAGVPARLEPVLVAALSSLELSEVIPAAHYARVAQLLAELPGSS